METLKKTQDDLSKGKTEVEDMLMKLNEEQVVFWVFFFVFFLLLYSEYLNKLYSVNFYFNRSLCPFHTSSGRPAVRNFSCQ